MQQIAELKNLFEEGDLDKNGKISRFELYAMLKKMHNSIDEETVSYLLAKYGNDRNQEINFFNFL
jgi:Ca2+-binding EF-hand superfamily protein